MAVRIDGAADAASGKKYTYPYTAPRTACALRSAPGRPSSTDQPAQCHGPLQDTCVSTAVAGTAHTCPHLPAGAGQNCPQTAVAPRHRQGSALPAWQGCSLRGKSSLTLHGFPTARIPQNALKGLNPTSLTTMLTHCLRANRCHLLREITGKEHPKGHCRQDSKFRTSVPRAERRCTPSAQGYRPLSPTATHGLLLKPSLHARRHPRDGSLCVQTRNESYARSGGACRAGRT
jgi:hypothetical protein